MERPSYIAGSLKIVMGFTFFFALGCASASYVEWFFVGSGAGEGSFTGFCFLYNYLYFFCMFLLSKSAFPNSISKLFPKNIFLISQFCLKYSVLFTFTLISSIQSTGRSRVQVFW